MGKRNGIYRKFTLMPELKAQMQAKGITIRKLSAVAGVSSGTIFNACHDKEVDSFLAGCIVEALAKWS